MHRTFLLSLAVCTGLVSCQRTPAPTPALSTAEATSSTNSHVFSAEITVSDVAELLKSFTSKASEDRGPNSNGEEKTIAYLRDQMLRIGLQPGNGDSWFQAVPVIETTTDPTTAPVLHTAGQSRPLTFGRDILLGTRTAQPEVKLDNSELVFVGYGVDAPEQQWNDYANQNWKGKTVVMLINNPDFHKGDTKLASGKHMTYYGYWTYKFEEAARKGAAAALIVHDSMGTAYNWDALHQSWSGPRYDLRAVDDSEPRLQVQGWISQQTARQLFADAGLDLNNAYRNASKRSFKPISLNARWSVDLKSTITQKTSHNVIGVLPGNQHADEAVIYTAHWDHLGKPTDNLSNDYTEMANNGIGVAGILEIAGTFTHQRPRPERSVVSLATAFKESGMLGSKYYVQHPSFPLDKIAGVINLDTMSASKRTRDLTVIGFGSSQLEDILKPVAALQGRTLHGETSPQNGAYFRSDHINFAKAGVPALYTHGGEFLRNGSTIAWHKTNKNDAPPRYHPNDIYNPATWTLDGTVDDLQALYEVGRALTIGGQWPNWYAGHPFKATRDRMMASKPTLMLNTAAQ
ncbi:M28 family peptidase [Xylella taiwanensis]|uniref:M28 family peptidase n=1 Tax=Xylella taiwanensis TaxID=1444770 RepID=UPI001E324CE0|nr:M28 family peptidase [Xylella taiwanensis]UFN22472.1 M28 family peptidase [Xylella taiwanensis]